MTRNTSEVASESGNLFSQVGSGYLCGRRFASLGPIRALTLRRLSTSAASLHVSILCKSYPSRHGKTGGKDAGMIR